VQPEGGAALPDLEHDATRAFVTARRMLEVDFLQVVPDLCHDERRRLREVSVQQLVDLVPRIEIGNKPPSPATPWRPPPAGRSSRRRLSEYARRGASKAHLPRH
jgi:hypothetical protein